MGKATDVLMDEHRGIERMLAAMERGIPRLQAGDKAALPLFAQAADFLAVFADRCHHYKEEKHLFPALKSKGTAANKIDELLGEHEQGRGHVRAMDAAVKRVVNGDAAALKDVASAASSYVRLLREHIAKEDELLKSAGESLGAGEQQSLAETFERVEVEIMGAGTHERYHQMLDNLDE